MSRICLSQGSAHRCCGKLSNIASGVVVCLMVAGTSWCTMSRGTTLRSPVIILLPKIELYTFMRVPFCRLLLLFPRHRLCGRVFPLRALGRRFAAALAGFARRRCGICVMAQLCFALFLTWGLKALYCTVSPP